MEGGTKDWAFFAKQKRGKASSFVLHLCPPIKDWGRREKDGEKEGPEGQSKKEAKPLTLEKKRPQLKIVEGENE